MKRLFLSIFALLFIGGSMAYAAVDYVGPKNIPLRPKGTSTKPIPRQIVDCAIEAFYEDGVITLNFTEDLGEATVFVINNTTGEVWFDSVDACGSSVVSISDDAGYYTITIYTEAGDYYGEFSI